MCAPVFLQTKKNIQDCVKYIMILGQIIAKSDKAEFFFYNHQKFWNLKIVFSYLEIEVLKHLFSVVYCLLIRLNIRLLESAHA